MSSGREYRGLPQGVREWQDVSYNLTEKEINLNVARVESGL